MTDYTIADDMQYLFDVLTEAHRRGFKRVTQVCYDELGAILNGDRSPSSNGDDSEETMILYVQLMRNSPTVRSFRPTEWCPHDYLDAVELVMLKTMSVDRNGDIQCNKVEAIKAIREKSCVLSGTSKTLLGLKDAKDLIEYIMFNLIHEAN